MVDVSALGAAVDSSMADLRRLCGELVAAPSVNPPGDTTGPAAVLLRELTDAGIAARLVAAAPAKPNVVASIEGSGPGRHLVLNVHLDTMPVGSLSDWTVPPFELTERDGRWYGLGMGNMKGAAAAMVQAFGLLHDHREHWAGTVTFTAVSDEVAFGPAGAQHLLDTVPGLAVADGVLCGEGPGWMRLGLAEKGLLWLRIEATADAGHASGAQRGTTATTRLAEAIVRLDALNEVMIDLPAELAAVPDHRIEARRLSVNIGTISGGTFIGQRAVDASAEIDIRIPCGSSLAEVEALVASCLADVDGVRWERRRGWEPNWSPPSDPIVAAVACAAETVRGGQPEHAVRLPASDASRWRLLGVGSICYGPQPTLSAGVDDHVTIADIRDCAVVYAAAALDFLTQPAPAPGADIRTSEGTR
jgi:succinyl-diaminopimelate desuccinylase